MKFALQRSYITNFYEVLKHGFFKLKKKIEATLQSRDIDKKALMVYELSFSGCSKERKEHGLSGWSLLIRDSYTRLEHGAMIEKRERTLSSNKREAFSASTLYIN